MKGKGILAAMAMIGMALILNAGCEKMSSPAEKGVSDTMLSESIIERVYINATPAEVWAYMLVEGLTYDEDKGTVTGEWAPEYKCEEYEGTRTAGTTCKSTLELAGRAFHQKQFTVEMIPGRKLVLKYAGDIDYTSTYFLAPHEKGTKLVVATDYSLELPEGLSREDMENAMQKMVDNSMAVVKEKVESGKASKEALAAVAAGQEVSSLSGTNVWSVVIDAPVEKVFAYMMDLSKYPEWMDADETISNIKGQGLGTTYDWEISLGSVVFRGKTLIVDYVENQRLTNKSWGDVEATNTYLFMPENGKTRVAYNQNATIVTPGMTRGEWDAVVKARKDQMEKYLQKAKAILEK